MTFGVKGFCKISLMRNLFVFLVLFQLLFSQSQTNSVEIYGSQDPAPQPAPVIPVSPTTQTTIILPLNEDERSPERKMYQVKRGDTLWRISKNTGVSVDQIKKLNSLKTDLIQVGQILIIEDNPLEIRRAIPVIPPVADPVEESQRVSDIVPPPIEKLNENPPVVVPTPPSPAPTTPQKPNSTPSPQVSAPKPNLKDLFIKEVRVMIRGGVRYNDSWRPEGSDRSWVMDCSNTTRYLFYKIFRLDIGRTASEQYYRLKTRGRAWDVPHDSSGRIDIEYLHKNLKVGDLLFWENTYKPERQPPITHVTVYMGTDDVGRFLMVGSEQGRGLLDQKFNGPDLYYFNPRAEKGGHHAFLFVGWRPGKFVAHGRPLNASSP